MKMEQTECSETSAYKVQTPGYYPEESIQYLMVVIIFQFFEHSGVMLLFFDTQWKTDSSAGT